MSTFDTLLVGRFLTFTFVLARVGGMVTLAPLWSLPAIPRRIRAAGAVVIALLVTPLYLGVDTSALTAGEYGWRLASEILVGLLLGLGVQIVLVGFQLAGQIAGELSGLSLTGVYDPAAEGSTSVFSQLYFLVALAVFVALGGHRQVTGALLETFVWAPPGSATLGNGFVDVLISALTRSFVLGIRVAAPVMIGLLLAALILGLVSRTLGHVNTMTVGFGLGALVALGTLIVSVAVIAWTLDGQTEDVLHELQCAVRSVFTR